MKLNIFNLNKFAQAKWNIDDERGSDLETTDGLQAYFIKKHDLNEYDALRFAIEVLHGDLTRDTVETAIQYLKDPGVKLGINDIVKHVVEDDRDIRRQFGEEVEEKKTDEDFNWESYASKMMKLKKNASKMMKLKKKHEDC
jgi:O-phosphoseryl-tRNA(Cys) synthetase